MGNKLKKLDIVLSLSFGFLFIMFIVYKLLDLKINYAFLNFFFSLVLTLFISFYYKTKLLKNKRYFVSIVLIIIKIISAIFNYNTNETLLLNFIDLLSFIFYIYSFNKLFDYSLNNEDKYYFTHFAYTILFFSFIYCLYNIISNFNQFDLLLNVNYRNFLSFSSFFQNRNTFAELLFISIIICDYLKITPMNKSKNKVKINFLEVFFIINSLLTLSRTCIFSLIIYYVIKVLNDRKSKKKFILCLPFLMVLILFLSSKDISYYIDSIIIRSDTGFSGRNINWEGAIYLFSKKPLIGYSTALSGKVLQNLIGNPYAHNMYLRTLINNGLFFMIGMIIIVIYQFCNNVTIYDEKNKKLFNSTFICILIYGLMEDYAFFSYGLINTLFTFVVFILPNLVIHEKK